MVFATNNRLNSPDNRKLLFNDSHQGSKRLCGCVGLLDSEQVKITICNIQLSSAPVQALNNCCAGSNQSRRYGGAFVDLGPSNKARNPLEIEIESTINQWSFYQLFRISSPPAQT